MWWCFSIKKKTETKFSNKSRISWSKWTWTSRSPNQVSMELHGNREQPLLWWQSTSSRGSNIRPLEQMTVTVTTICTWICRIRMATTLSTIMFRNASQAMSSTTSKSATRQTKPLAHYPQHLLKDAPRPQWLGTKTRVTCPNPQKWSNSPQRLGTWTNVWNVPVPIRLEATGLKSRYSHSNANCLSKSHI